MPTPEEMALLRATVSGDFDKAQELSKGLTESNSLDGFGEVIGAAFLIAIRMQFPRQYSIPDIIRLVANARMQVDQTGEFIDPRSAEFLVRAALGEEDLAASLADDAVIQIQIAICSVLAHRGRLGDPTAFVDEVEKLLAEWAAEDEAE